jgi:hypothetical protein
MRSSRHAARPASGEGKLGCVLWLLLLAALAFAAAKIGPVYVRSSQLKDYMGEQAKFAQQLTPDNMKLRVLTRAKELRLPLDPRRVEVLRTEGRIRITADYTVPVDLYVYQRDWDFHLEVDEPIFVW